MRANYQLLKDREADVVAKLKVLEDRDLALKQREARLKEREDRLLLSKELNIGKL